MLISSLTTRGNKLLLKKYSMETKQYTTLAIVVSLAMFLVSWLVLFILTCNVPSLMAFCPII